MKKCTMNINLQKKGPQMCMIAILINICYNDFKLCHIEIFATADVKMRSILPMVRDLLRNYSSTAAEYDSKTFEKRIYFEGR